MTTSCLLISALKGKIGDNRLPLQNTQEQLKNIHYLSMFLSLRSPSLKNPSKNPLRFRPTYEMGEKWAFLALDLSIFNNKQSKTLTLLLLLLRLSWMNAWRTQEQWREEDEEGGLVKNVRREGKVDVFFFFFGFQNVFVPIFLLLAGRYKGYIGLDL